VFFQEFLEAVAGWLIGYPLSRLVPRDSALLLVIGRRGPVFADNSKYFFTYVVGQMEVPQRCIFLTSDADLCSQITSKGGLACRHPSWRSWWLLMRAGIVVTDMADWFRYGAYAMTRGARIVQIWHGAPLKHIELDQFRTRLARLSGWANLALGLHKRVIGRYPCFDLVVTTSQAFTDLAFRDAFRAREFVCTGYPRNDVLLRHGETRVSLAGLEAINVDAHVLEAVREARSRGRTIILYVPTYRKDGGNPFDGPMDLARLSRFALENSALVVLKLHPLVPITTETDGCLGLIHYDSRADVYPLMPLCDILVTDYSSIFFDYLLLDRPVVFFAYDLAQYLAQDSAMYFPYDSMTPGGVCQDQDGLERLLAQILADDGRDGFAQRRGEVRNLTYDHQDSNSAQRLFQRLVG
jgi:CDP-glycerol glycerophosphotransferase (TagB/SpsB family)